MKATGRLFLIPVPLAPDANGSLSPAAIGVIHTLKHFIAENARTARRFIKTTDPPHAINELTLNEWDKHGRNDPGLLLKPVFDGIDVGFMSEAGSPGIADPGSQLVTYAHDNGVQVIPLAGPSSILLALIASGLDGQKFQFHGYLSSKKELLATDLKRLESLTRNSGTQIFIEAPYRNRQIIEVAFSALADTTRLCIAADLTSTSEWICTRTIGQWKRSEIPDLHKRPCVYCIGV